MRFKSGLLGLAGVLLVAAPAVVSAQTPPAGFTWSRSAMKPAASGTVASVIGNSVVLTESNSTSVTVDVTNAKIGKFGNGPLAAIQASGIQTGDHLTVFGTLSGTEVTATRVIDGTFTSKAKPTASNSSAVKSTTKKFAFKPMKLPPKKTTGTVAKPAPSKTVTGKTNSNSRR